MATPLTTARTLLFVPGNRPERFAKALTSGADAVVVDLEDSVPLADKAGARTAIADAWPTLLSAGVPLVVRINPLETDTGQEDLAWLASLPPPAGVMVPKAESIDTLARASTTLRDVALLPLIETAAGLAALPGLGGAPGVLRLVVGHIDFVADLGLLCDEDETQIAPLRFAVAMATRLHRLAPAIDGVTADIKDAPRLQRDTLRALGFGFGGKLCIHPAQVPVVHEALAPTAEQLSWAERVVQADAASGGAAVQVDGRMVDVPVVLQARRLLARAAR